MSEQTTDIIDPGKLSVAIITFNEEKNIRRCLDSLSDIADEIVVVDSFSTDETKNICMEYDVCFSTHPFEGHIQQKNIAVDYCSHSMVLALDADEALSTALRSSILKEKAKGFPQMAYTMNRLNNYCGQWIKHSGWYPDKKLRLFHKASAHWGGQNPHDKIVLTQGKAIHLKGDLLHYSYYHIDEHIAQAKRFSTVAANALFQKGKKSNLLHAIFKGGFKFFRNYILKLGFLDGKNGLIICKITATETYWKYLKLARLYTSSSPSK